MYSLKNKLTTLCLALLFASIPFLHAEDAPPKPSVPDPNITLPAAEPIFASISKFALLKKVVSQSEEKDFELLVVEDRQEHVKLSDLRRAQWEDAAGTPDFYQFNDVVGRWFHKGNSRLAHTDKLLSYIEKNITEVIAGAGKKKWNRLRPFLQDTHVKYLGSESNRPFLKDSPSFPSGHSTSGIMFALVLGDLLPSRYQERLLARGRQFGDDRVLLGVHFPSDVEAGRLLAPKIYEAIRSQPGYISAVKEARRECLRELNR